MSDPPFLIGEKVQVKKGLNIVNYDTFEPIPHGKTFVVSDISPLNPYWIKEGAWGEWAIQLDMKPNGYFAVHFEKAKTIGFLIE